MRHSTGTTARPTAQPPPGDPCAPRSADRCCLSTSGGSRLLLQRARGGSCRRSRPVSAALAAQRRRRRRLPESCSRPSPRADSRTRPLLTIKQKAIARNLENPGVMTAHWAASPVVRVVESLSQRGACQICCEAGSNYGLQSRWQSQICPSSLRIGPSEQLDASVPSDRGAQGQ